MPECCQQGDGHRHTMWGTETLTGGKRVTGGAAGELSPLSQREPCHIMADMTLHRLQAAAFIRTPARQLLLAQPLTSPAPGPSHLHLRSHPPFSQRRLADAFQCPWEIRQSRVGLRKERGAHQPRAKRRIHMCRVHGRWRIVSVHCNDLESSAPRSALELSTALDRSDRRTAGVAEGDGE
ncbi:unnamed protein product [Pleuronectes platessa]|uniref:Uncharacterized protein n=1 Tax=Pleuronectes platessa TaxID=8262 RepID=A0A9N7TNJ3_PLEPL|nr:unnamed protein product [Pleuronectes platessa]